MKRYQPAVPHVLIGLCAMALTSVTLAMAVVVPATYDCSAREVRTLAVAPAATAVAISPARIDVVAIRGRATAS